MLSLNCGYICFLLVPVKLLAGKIVSEMTYIVTSGMLNSTIPYRTTTTVLNCMLTAEMDDGDDTPDSGSQKGDAGLPRTDYSQLIVWQVYS